MHEPLLAQAALPSPTVILGLTLRPYSIGHELFLIRQGNPLLCGGTVTPAHIREAILICSETWTGAKALNSDRLIRFKIWLWKVRTARHNLELAREAWTQYRKDGLACFPRGDAPAGSKPGRQYGAPYLLRLVQFLVLKWQLPEAEAWDYPLALAQMHYHCHLETEGLAYVRNDEEETFDEYCARKDAEFLAAQQKEKETPCPAS